MSKISTVYDYFLTQLPILFPTKKKIPNPYSLLDNNMMLLDDSWGLKTEGHGINSLQFNSLTQEYNFKVILCREVRRVESDTTVFDTETKQIEEDTFKIREFFYDMDCNGIPGTILLTSLGPTDPIGFLGTGKNNYIFIETSILIRISEQFANC